MSAKILCGKTLAEARQTQLAIAVAEWQQQTNMAPGLDVILVGDNPASTAYVRTKQKACEKVGIRSRLHRLAETATAAQLEQQIDACNQDPNCHGILLQLPLPTHLNSQKLLYRIHPEKDVDGFHPYNMGRLALNHPTLHPCTPYGVMSLLTITEVNLAGLHAVVVGRSAIVGRPMMLELLNANCTVTCCHSQSRDIAKLISDADILIAALGKPGVIQSAWIKPGAIVIDVGFNRLADGKITGDIEFNRAAQQAGWITPVPGGVGPMTVTTLLENTLQAAKAQYEHSHC